MRVILSNYLFSSLLNDVINIIRMRMIDSPIHFMVNVDSNIPNELIGDELRIRQVLINILGNAVKYTATGFIFLSVKGEPADGGKIHLTMQVEDSGRGIKPDEIDMLFSEYVQVDTEKNTGIEGVGLGLSISYRLIKAMGGDIGVESEYGKGSTFTITLPQKVHTPGKLAIINKPEDKNVLLYERHETYADSIAFTLNNLGVTYDAVTNHLELYDKLSENNYSHIFISLALYNDALDVIKSLDTNAKIVLLMEFGETIPDKRLNTLVMPIHAISVANILNGTSGSFAFSDSSETVIRFIAPGARVLVVDDIKTNLKVSKGLLLPYKMEVDLCESGKEAIEAVKAKDYDIILMDHKMPEMDGVEATSRIRALGDEGSYYRKLPIVALTANAVVGMRQIFLENGFDDYLSKPIDTVKLNAVLEQWISKEKQQNPTAEENAAAAARKQEPEVLFEIKGVDVEKGVRRTGGTLELYVDTLSTFHEDGLNRIILLKGCLKANDMSLYATHVHALKSAAANIGALELSKTAHVLEKACNVKDMAFVGENNGPFLTALEALLDEIRATVAGHKESRGADKGPFDLAGFKSELKRLDEALGSMDAGAINQAIGALQGMAHTAEAADLTGALSKHILMSDYDEAAELIMRYLTQV
jgi:CheY-like chemotaxis protein/HPt (histidine-containing phosphotransfer) domain-containing protein